MTKKNLTLTIEENLLDEGKKHIPNLSSFFEEVLIHYLGYGEEVQFKVLDAEKELDKIREAQLNLFLLARDTNIDAKKRENEVKKKKKKWRVMVNEYIDTLTYDADAIGELSKLSEASSKTIEDMLDYCFMHQEDSFNEFYTTMEMMTNDSGHVGTY